MPAVLAQYLEEQVIFEISKSPCGNASGTRPVFVSRILSLYIYILIYIYIGNIYIYIIYIQYASRNPAGLLVVSCFPGFGSLVPEFLGSLVLWFPSSLVPWFHGSLVPWFLSPRFPVLCLWISLAEAMQNKTECCFCFFAFVLFVLCSIL